MSKFVNQYKMHCERNRLKIDCLLVSVAMSAESTYVCMRINILCLKAEQKHICEQ